MSHRCACLSHSPLEWKRLDLRTGFISCAMKTERIMVFGRKICGTLMALLLAASPATHAIAGSHQHAGSSSSMFAMSLNQSGHHDHSAHDHGSKPSSESASAGSSESSESSEDDKSKACCHNSGGICAYLVPTAENAVSGSVHSALIEGPRTTPHLSHLILVSPPPRTLS